MPHFKVILSGRGIDYALGDMPVVGFFTTRLVNAPTLAAAESKAKDVVKAEWLSDGPYAAANRGSIPSLEVEQSFQVGRLAAFFARKPAGYSFYRHED